MSQDSPETMTDDSAFPVPATEEEAAAPAGPTPAEPAPAAPPAWLSAIPDKFKDPLTGEACIEAMAKSYVELERWKSAFTQADGSLNEPERTRLFDLLGRPAAADGYDIASPHALIAPEPELNARLHAAGFTQAQAQLVYELAAERLLPAVADMVAEVETQRQVDRLQRHFGGPESFAEVTRQIRTWAEGNLDPEAYAALAGSHDGVLALHQMMRATEPRLLDGLGDTAGPLTEDALGEMMRDPRYWRQRDPEFVARVTEGFRKLYGR